MATTGRNKTLFGVILALFLVGGAAWLAGSAGHGAVAAAPPGQESPVWAAPAAGEGLLLRGLEQPVGGHPQIESALNQLLAAYQAQGLSGARGFAQAHGVVLDGDRAQVVLVSEPEAVAGLKAAVRVHGGQVQAEYGGLIQALVPLAALEKLADRPDIVRIREPRYGYPLSVPASRTAPGLMLATSEGVAASNAAAWHAAGVTGTGVDLAVVDSGFEGYTGLLGSDLPSSVTTYSWTGDGLGGSEHGTANAEIAFDMAPGATFYLHKINTDVELGQAVGQAVADGVEVISMSVGWLLDGPGDGTGSLADMVSLARTNGISFANAAGNMAEISWSGAYDNVVVDTYNLHDWDGTGAWVNFLGPNDSQCYIFPAGLPITAGLHWDDWTAANQDYDLLLVSWPGSGTTVYLEAASTNPQNGGLGQTPEELVSAVAEADNCYGFVVQQKSSTRSVCLRLMVAPFLAHLSYWTPPHSLVFPADAAGAVAVGAVDVNAPHAYETYSSQGPTLGAGGACTGGAVKPELAAYTNVSTVTYGAGAFAGTSSAAPHVAGAAVLVRQANPGYSVDQVQDFLEQRAIDLGAAGQDTLYGWGRLHLGAPPAVANTPPALSGLPDRVVPKNGSDDMAIDLWAYASDLQSTDSQLTFAVDNTPDSNAGVSITGNRYVAIAPATDWTGQTDVTVRASDPGGLSAADTFQVTVAEPGPPSQVYLPLIARNVSPNLIFADDFGDSASGWPSFDEEWGKGGYLNGEYQLLARLPWVNALATPDLVLPGNYRLEVDARQVSANPGSCVVMFGVQWAGSTYEALQFVVYPSTKEYLLERRDLDGTWTTLIDWTYHPAIGAGSAVNRLAVERVGTAVSLYTNGTLLATITEPGLTGPGRDGGVRVYSYDDAPVEMHFDNFAAYELP